MNLINSKPGLKSKLWQESVQVMLNASQGTCRNFPYVFKGDLLDYISVIATQVTLLNSSFISAVGNLVVAYVFYSTRQLWQRKHIFTINLTLINLFTALLGIPTYFIFLLTFVNGDAWCRLGDVSFGIHRFCFSMTVVSVSLISYQRIFSVLYPYRYQAVLTLERHTLIAVASWFYGLILTVPFAAEIKLTPWPVLKEFCFASKIILLVHITSTILCYGRMSYIASCHRRKISHNSRHIDKISKTKKTSLNLVGTLLASTLPWLGLKWMQSEHSIQVEYFTNAIFFTSCFFNLFLYTLRNEDIEAVVQRKVKRKVTQELHLPRARTTAQPRFQETSIRPHFIDMTTMHSGWLH